jgi:type VI protein secretion system component VasF
MSQRDLVAELHATRVAAPPELRERVLLIAASDRTPVRRRFTWRRAFVVALPVAAAIAASIVFTRPSQHTAQPIVQHGVAHGSSTFKAAPAGLAPTLSVPAPSRTRAQRYGADLTLRVPSATRVSDGVKRALDIVRSLGGYATSVHATTKGRNAHAELTLKVPRAHVQEAVSQLSTLGTITGEQVDVQDLQTGLNATDRTIAQLQRQLKSLRARPASAANDAKIAALVARVQKLQRAEATTIRAARYATVHLRMTTPAVAHASPGHGRLHGIVVALTWLGIGLAYALAVGVPLLVLVAFAWLALRTIRRRREDALLSRS